jgi:ADP-ribose pyrophosphatase YjhB (NUDIX family)
VKVAIIRRPSLSAARQCRPREEPLHHCPAVCRIVLQCIGKPAPAMQGSTVVKAECQRFSVKDNAQNLRKRLEPTLRRAFHFYWWLARGMTLGVRAVVLNDKNRIFLVKHSYVSGWHLPGGGVEAGETLRQALARELAEEGRIELLGEPKLHGLFLNSHVSRRDHVAVYLVRQFRQDHLPQPNREIVDCGFFEAGALPADTTAGTRLRISEVIEGRAPIATWR